MNHYTCSLHICSCWEKNYEIIQAIITDLSVSDFKRKILPVNCVTILTWNLIYDNKLKKKKSYF